MVFYLSLSYLFLLFVSTAFDKAKQLSSSILIDDTAEGESQPETEASISTLKANLKKRDLSNTSGYNLLQATAKKAKLHKENESDSDRTDDELSQYADDDILLL